MSAKERTRRPKLDRTQPIRRWSTMFEAPPATPGTAAPRGASMNDVVSRSVDLGYRVIDEYIRQGQRAAQRINDRSFGPETLTNDFQEAGTRLAQYASDFAALWIELMQLTTVGGSARWPVPRPDSRPAAAPADAPPPPAAAAVPEERASRASARAVVDRFQKDFSPHPEALEGGVPRKSEVPTAGDHPRVKIAVASTQLTEVDLDLRPETVGRRLLIQALRAVEPGKPKLTDVSFDQPPNGETVMLQIRVPASQPAGVYNGLIIDEETSRPVGSLSVRVRTE